MPEMFSSANSTFIDIQTSPEGYFQLFTRNTLPEETNTVHCVQGSDTSDSVANSLSHLRG